MHTHVLICDRIWFKLGQGSLRHDRYPATLAPELLQLCSSGAARRCEVLRGHGPEPLLQKKMKVPSAQTTWENVDRDLAELPCSRSAGM